MRATYLVIIGLLTSTQEVNTIGCEDSNVDTNICYGIYKTVKQSLYKYGGNLYEMRRVYFYSPNANPILLRVEYNITIFNLEKSTLPVCTEDPINITSQKSFTAGWTSSGVFTIFDPMTVNFMQLQLPFAVMRFCYTTMKKHSPEANTFLWDGSYNLPTLYLKLHIDQNDWSCIPSNDMFESVLLDITSMLRVYAGNHKDGILHDSDNIHYVGFYLPENSVSNDKVNDHVFGMYFHWLYVPATVMFIFALCHFTARFLISKSSHTSASKFFQKHTEFIVGPIFSMLPFLIFEFLIELIMAIKWCSNDPSNCPVVITSEIIYFIPDIVTIAAFIYYAKKRMEVPCACARSCCKNLTKIISNEYHGAFVWMSALFGYHIIYSFFPLFILAFAYPTKVLSMLIFMTGFMVSFTAFVIIFVHIYLKDDAHEDNTITKKKIIIFFVIGFLFLGSLLYYFGVLAVLLYTLVIGKASVISSAPLALLSILPSLIIGGIVWMLKNVVFGSSIHSEYGEVQ